MFEWKHPNYYKELKKLREEAEKEKILRDKGFLIMSPNLSD